MSSPSHLASRPRRSLKSLPREARLRLDRSRMMAAEQAILAAFPEWSPAERRGLLAHAVRCHAVRLRAQRVLRRISDIELCRRLTLRDWDQLLEAESRRRGLIVISGRFGVWQAVARTLAVYRRRVRLLLQPEADLEREASILARSAGFTVELLEDEEEAAPAAPASGEIMMVLLDQSAGGGPLELPLSRRGRTPSARAAAISLAGGAPLIPLFGLCASSGRFRVTARPPTGPEPGDDPAILAARCLESVEAEILRRPEQWAGWLHREAGSPERSVDPSAGEAR